MENYYLYIENNKWRWYDGALIGIATVTQERVSDYCLERADEMRNSTLGNYEHLTAEQREKLAKLWEDAINLPCGKYEYYFNLEGKTEGFIELVRELGEKLGVRYELIIKD